MDKMGSRCKGSIETCLWSPGRVHNHSSSGGRVPNIPELEFSVRNLNTQEKIEFQKIEYEEIRDLEERSGIKKRYKD